MPFRNRIKEFCHDERINVAEFIKKTGVSKTVVYSMSGNPRRLCKLKTMEQMCDRYGVPISKLLIWEEDPGLRGNSQKD
jgi:DNA-binding Xre family transcriptional regulator